MVTVCACNSIACRIRSALVCTSSTVPWIELLASTVCLVAAVIALILAVISSVARAVWLARLFTSCATTAKPRPASPARAASMVALSARRLVCPAMSRIRPRIDLIASTCADSAWLTLTACAAWSPARSATPAAVSTSERASSIARIRPAAVCAASRIATADCSAAAATSLVLPSIPRVAAAVWLDWLRSMSLSLLARATDAHHPAIEFLRLGLPLAVMLLLLEMNGMRHEHVDLDHAEFVNGPRRRGAIGRIVHQPAARLDHRFGFARQAGQQGGQRDARSPSHPRHSAWRYRPTLRLRQAQELVAQIGHDPLGQLLELGVVELLSIAADARDTAPRTCGRSRVLALHQRPQRGGPFGQVARGIERAEGGAGDVASLAGIATIAPELNVFGHLPRRDWLRGG